MHYNKDELVEDCVNLIQEHGLFNITQLIGFLSISSSTFYNYELDKSKRIKDAIRKSKSKEFAEAFQRMKANESAAAQIATCKVLGDEDVRNALNGVSREDTNIDRELTIKRKVINNRDDIAK
jgi:hypothetical protein|tara:strand:- start:4227 stop:4595 length:369 start_codon:yes stop_codon:yes gene_type:complete